MYNMLCLKDISQALHLFIEIDLKRQKTNGQTAQKLLL